jgi:hypothetical protein
MAGRCHSPPLGVGRNPHAFAGAEGADGATLAELSWLAGKEERRNPRPMQRLQFFCRLTYAFCRRTRPPNALLVDVL